MNINMLKQIKDLNNISLPISFNGVVILLNINIDDKDNADLRNLLMNILNNKRVTK